MINPPPLPCLGRRQWAAGALGLAVALVLALAAPHALGAALAFGALPLVFLCLVAAVTAPYTSEEDR